MKGILIDCDPGIDDSLALMLALASPELPILGITTVSGNIEVNQATENAFTVLALMDRKDIPVHKGASVPLRREFFDATDTHGRDGIGENFFKPTGLKPGREGAEDFILRTISENPGEITLLCLGPLTNIARAIQKDRAAMSRVGKVILMGGAAQFHGNCSPVAEYNFWVDPDAAREVFLSGIAKPVMAGLDVTHRILFSPNLREVVRQFGGKRGDFIHAVTRFYVDFHWRQERTIGCVINDPLVIAMLLDEDIVRGADAYVDVETTGPAIGQSLCDIGGKHRRGNCNAHVALEVNPRRFFEVFLNRLFPGKSSDIGLALQAEYGLKEKI